jgi:hypothetical protein
VPANPPAPPLPATPYDEAQLRQWPVPFPPANVAAGSAKPKKKKAAVVSLTRNQIIGRIEALLNNWIAAGAPLYQGTPNFNLQADQDAYSLYLDKLGGGWGEARRQLITAIGAYCSYCGSSVFSHLAIEHKLPKSTFPADAFSYLNFLLACSSCNSAKGNTPNQATVPGAPLGTAACKTLIKNQGAGQPKYFWPDYNWPAGIGANPFYFKYTLTDSRII